MNKNIEIRFHDYGQDFLKWEVTPKGKIVKSAPFQFRIWSKWEVINLNDLKVGGVVRIRQYQGKEQQLTVLTIKYPIAEIKEVEHATVPA